MIRILRRLLCRDVTSAVIAGGVVVARAQAKGHTWLWAYHYTPSEVCTAMAEAVDESIMEGKRVTSDGKLEELAEIGVTGWALRQLIEGR